MGNNELVKGEFSRITPERAATLAQTKIDQGYPINWIDKKLVDRLAEALKNNRWKPHASVIQISSDGILLNGLHRCRASVVSGIPLETIVVTINKPTIEGEES